MEVFKSVDLKAGAGLEKVRIITTENVELHLSALVVFFAVGLLLYLGLLCRRQTRRARPEVYNYEKIYQIDSEDSDSDAELYLGGYR